MTFDEIAHEIALAAIERVEPHIIIGNEPHVGDAEAIGKKFGELYLSIVNTIQSDKS